ncbi:MAG: indole-3-glycerol phosphate synthase TrpC [Pseudobacteriovorax sp.]|nr:indole-3-glycerol phosphate synthase TrpC [Pseudobacteriovorax sp.]
MSVLKEIGEYAQKRVDSDKGIVPIEVLKSKISADLRSCHDFKACFADLTAINIVAEYKRASPSKGDIAPELTATGVTDQYLESGAKALSILTEPKYFSGNIEFISTVRKKHSQAVILMKDFFVDEYQLLQARLYGADVVLLIVGLLGEKRCLELYDYARELGLSVLVEVHDQAELDVALQLEHAVLGINNRDLRDLSISLSTTEKLMQSVPKERIAISESGIESHSDIQRLLRSGVRGFLVGTSLMKTKTPGVALKQLIGGES